MTKQQHSSRFVGVVLETIGAPLAWGLIATFAFYFAVNSGVVDHPLVIRYTAGHPVEYVEVGLFLVGLVAVFGRGRRAAGQLLTRRSLNLTHEVHGTLADQVTKLQDQLADLPSRLRNGLYACRLTDALEHLKRHNSADHLDDELKYLSDMDAEKSHEGYGLVRIIIWATPMLGFLGTVIGITLALGDLSPEALVNSPKDAMEGLLSGLSIAFDTTALALTLSMILMFAQFLTQQTETQLLAQVDRRVTDDLTPYFRRTEVSRDPQVAALQHMSQAMLGAMEENTRRQTEIWQESLVASQHQWGTAIGLAGDTIRDVVSGALCDSLREHTDNLIKLEEAAGLAAASNWQQVHLNSAEAMQQLQEQQAKLVRHGEILEQAMKATGEVVGLEKALNQNLRALAGAKNFEDTVMSLSAAIHLLSTRLSKPMPRDNQVKLGKSSEERAA